jgi:hypothetical protein
MSNEINESFNNNHHSVITIVKEVLGQDAQEHIVESLAFQIVQHFDKMDKKLDDLLDNKALVDYLTRQIIEASSKNHSLEEQLKKSQQEHETLLAELEKIKLEQIASDDVDFAKVIEEAEEALVNYDSQKYQNVLAQYRKSKKQRAC